MKARADFGARSKVETRRTGMNLSTSRKVAFVFVAASLVALTFFVSTMAAEDTQIKLVNVTQKGAPPSGPYPVVVEHDQKFATHTIYRPATLGPSKHSMVVWGEGACVKNGLTFPEFLSEIASYGFVVVADGPPVAAAPRGAGPG